MDNRKLDKDIKQFFDKRVIEPSPDNWDRLDAMLSVSEKPKNKKPFAMYMVAASTLLVGIFCYVIFEYTSSRSGSLSSSTITYDSNKPDDQKTITLTRQLASAFNSEIISLQSKSMFTSRNQEVVLQKNNKQVETENPKNIVDQDKVKDIFNEESVGVVHATEALDLPSNVQEGNPETEKIGIKIDPNSLLSIVETKLAQKETMDFHAEIKKKYGIAPKTLLRKAENISAQTFMAKVWRTIQDKSTPVITAVANRNQ